MKGMLDAFVFMYFKCLSAQLHANPLFTAGVAQVATSPVSGFSAACGGRIESWCKSED